MLADNDINGVVLLDLDEQDITEEMGISAELAAVLLGKVRPPAPPVAVIHARANTTYTHVALICLLGSAAENSGAHMVLQN